MKRFEQPEIELLYTVEDSLDAAALSFEDVQELSSMFCHFYKLTCPLSLEVSVVTPSTITAYNLQTRSIDRPTDVLSFPLDFTDVAAEGTVAVVNRALQMEPRAHLGEVVICQEIADQQRHQFGNSLANEMRLLLVHSLFHLIGYDHITEGDMQMMRAQEDAFLAYYNERSTRLSAPLTLSSTLMEEGTE